MFEGIACHKPMFYRWFKSSFCEECEGEEKKEIRRLGIELKRIHEENEQFKIDNGIINGVWTKRKKECKGNSLYCQKHYMTLPCLECSDESGKIFPKKRI
jgi:hypothetical protein